MFDKPDKRKVGQSIRAINETVYRIYFFVIQVISYMPAIAFWVIASWLIFNFSWWNLLLGVITHLVISIVSNLFSVAVLLFLSYVLDRTDKNNKTISDKEQLDEEFIREQILKFYSECKTKENFRSAFEDDIMHFIIEHSNSQVRKEDIHASLSKIAGHCKRRNLGAKEYLVKVHRLSVGIVLEKDYSTL